MYIPLYNMAFIVIDVTIYDKLGYGFSSEWLFFFLYNIFFPSFRLSCGGDRTPAISHGCLSSRSCLCVLVNYPLPLDMYIRYTFDIILYINIYIMYCLLFSSRVVSAVVGSYYYYYHHRYCYYHDHHYRVPL